MLNHGNNKLISKSIGAHCNYCLVLTVGSSKNGLQVQSVEYGHHFVILMVETGSVSLSLQCAHQRCGLGMWKTIPEANCSGVTVS